LRLKGESDGGGSVSCGREETRERPWQSSMRRSARRQRGSRATQDRAPRRGRTSDRAAQADGWACTPRWRRHANWHEYGRRVRPQVGNGLRHGHGEVGTTTERCDTVHAAQVSVQRTGTWEHEVLARGERGSDIHRSRVDEDEATRLGVRS
jgi:hypothetical protein